MFVATVVEDHAYNWGGVELEASTFIRMLSLCTSVRVPLTDILDKLVRHKVIAFLAFTL